MRKKRKTDSMVKYLQLEDNIRISGNPLIPDGVYKVTKIYKEFCKVTISSRLTINLSRRYTDPDYLKSIPVSGTSSMYQLVNK